MFKKRTLLLVAVLVLSMLTTALPAALAADGASVAVNPAGVFPIVNEPLTLTVAVPRNTKVEDLYDNDLTQWLEEKTGITFEFVELSMSASDQNTQVNVMMNSGDLPDLFIGYNFPYDSLATYAEAGLVLPLDDLIAQYATEDGYYRMVNDFPVENVEAYITIDGSVYSAPSGSSLVTNIYAGYAMRIQSEFLEALNMAMPQTLDEYYNFLVAVRDNDVNGNGDPNDEIPLTTYGEIITNLYRNIGNAFQYTDPDTYLKVNDGVVSFTGNTDQLLQTIEYIKKLLDEDLLDPASFTQDANTVRSRGLDSTVIASAASGYKAGLWDTASAQYFDLRVAPPFEGPDGYRSTAYMAPVVYRSMVITKDCVNPAAAYRLMDLFLTEEASVRVRIGAEGAQWEAASQGQLGRNNQQAKYSLIGTQEWTKPSTRVLWDMNNMIWEDAFNYVAEPETSATYWLAKSMWEAKMDEYYTAENLPTLLLDVEDSIEYEELRQMITDHINSNIALFALGDRPLDEWDKFVSELNSMGVARYLELAQTGCDNISK